MLGDVAVEKFAAGGVLKIDDLDAVFAKPFDAAGKCLALAHNYFAEPKLTDEPAAVPARRKGGDQDEIAIALLAACAPERVDFGMHAGVTLLHAPIMATA